MKIMTSRVLTLFLSATVLLPLQISQAASIDCNDFQALADHPEQTLACANQVLRVLPETKLLNQKEESNHTRYDFSFSSVAWPKLPENSPYTDPYQPTVWQHTLSIDVPKSQNNQTHTAFLLIDSGSNYPEEKDHPTQLFSDLEKVLGDQTVLIDVPFIPNQSLLVAGKPLEEDEIVADTWNRYVVQPKLYAYYPLHIPMTVAVRQAMDVAQAEMAKYGVKIDQFVVAGVSKRGWTTWLVGLSDDRVTGIIPIVINALNTTEQVKLIHHSYGEHWPIALGDYYAQHVTEVAQENSLFYPQWQHLMQIEDPYSYFKQSSYRKRLKNLGKYIVVASGDDFFTPDAASLYYNEVPGNKSLLYLANSPHDIKQSPQYPQLIDSIVAFYQNQINHKSLPPMRWETTSTHSASSTKLYMRERPLSVQAWLAKNDMTRDFRFNCGIHYESVGTLEVKKRWNGYEAFYQLPISESSPWSAYFLQVTYPKGVMLSTDVVVTPKDKFPSPTQIMPQQGACLLIDLMGKK